MIAACIVGLRYYAIILRFAFIMGIARTLVTAPRFGATAAVLVEIPIVVALSSVVARRLLRRRAFSLAQRVAMGASAFTLTMASEAVLARLLRGQTVADWARDITTPLGLTGLAGQVAFAVVPILVTQRRKSPRDSA